MLCVTRERFLVRRPVTGAARAKKWAGVEPSPPHCGIRLSRCGRATNLPSIRLSLCVSLVRQAKPGFSTELKSEQHDKKVSNM